MVVGVVIAIVALIVGVQPLLAVGLGVGYAILAFVMTPKHSYGRVEGQPKRLAFPRLPGQRRPWLDRWTVDVNEREGHAALGYAWEWDIFERDWKLMEQSAEIMIAVGDPEQAEFMRRHLANPEARYVYRSRWSQDPEHAHVSALRSMFPDLPASSDTYRTQEEALIAANQMADYLWPRVTPL